MIDIGTLLMEQSNKIAFGGPGAGRKYGPDWNILRAIVEYSNDISLVPNLVKSLGDEDLKRKVGMWMFQGVRNAVCI